MLFKFIGHCYNQKENHDKVWGVIFLDAPNVYHGNTLVFWGRRGKKLQTQVKTNDWELTKLVRKKEKEYTEVDENKLNEVYPEFQADLEKTAMWAQLML